MVDWWNQLNPSWRHLLTRGLPRPDYTSKSLLSLRKGGQHGLVTVILGLYWWRHSRQSPEDTWLGMVNDMAKTIDVILRPERKWGQKCPSNGGEGNTSSKRTKVWTLWALFLVQYQFMFIRSALSLLLSAGFSTSYCYISLCFIVVYSIVILYILHSHCLHSHCILSFDLLSLFPGFYFTWYINGR